MFLMANRTENYRRACGSDGCGGSCKTKHEWNRGRLASNEAEKPTRESGSPLGLPLGKMSTRSHSRAASPPLRMKKCRMSGSACTRILPSDYARKLNCLSAAFRPGFF